MEFTSEDIDRLRAIVLLAHDISADCEDTSAKLDPTSSEYRFLRVIRAGAIKIEQLARMTTPE